MIVLNKNHHLYDIIAALENSENDIMIEISDYGEVIIYTGLECMDDGSYIQAKEENLKSK